MAVSGWGIDETCSAWTGEWTIELAMDVEFAPGASGWDAMTSVSLAVEIHDGLHISGCQLSGVADLIDDAFDPLMESMVVEIGEALAVTIETTWEQEVALICP